MAFKNILVRVPAEVADRVERLTPSRKWDKKLVPEFRGQILQYGLEHPLFLKMESQRQIDALKRENAYLKRQVDLASSKTSLADVLKSFEKPGSTSGGGGSV